MSKIKILAKRGKPSWKEKKLLDQLEQEVEKRMATDPNFASNFRPVNSYEELEKMHKLYFTEDAEIVEDEKINNKNINNKNINMKKEVSSSNQETESNFSFNDPLNAEDPIIRDYVLKGESFENNNTTQNNEINYNRSYDEPTSFDEAFKIPNLDDDDNIQSSFSNQNNASQQNNENQSNQSSQSTNKDNSVKKEPVNPYFDDQSNSNKKKQTKRFAKYITSFVCFALEKGYVWYTTKDINEARMVEYELKGDIDVSIMLTLDDNTQVTVKHFFQRMCSDAKANAVILKEDQEELADALADVLMEKGIAPTPTQTLMMVSLQIIGKQAFSAFLNKNTTNGILEQLKALKKQKDAEEEDILNEMESNSSNNNQSYESKSNTSTDIVEYEEAKVVN